MLRYFVMIPLAIALMTTATACEMIPSETTVPTVAFGYDDPDDYGRIEAQAELYCEEQYEKDAVLVQRKTTAEGYEARFACRETPLE